MISGAVLMFHCALISNLKVTDGSLFALVLDALLSQFVMVADSCAVLYSVQGAYSQEWEGLSRSTSSGACPRLIFSSRPWEMSAIVPLYREGN